MERKIVSSMERNIGNFEHVFLPLATFSVRPDSSSQADCTVYESWTENLYAELSEFRKTTVRKES